MSFLQKLWDETLAGPAPDSGLGRLRKYNSFSASRSPSMLSNSIAIPPRIEIPNSSLDQTSSPQSPTSCSSTPPTPHPTPPGTPREDDMKRLTRRRTIDYPRRRPLEGAERTSPTVYDWIVITALDR